MTEEKKIDDPSDQDKHRLSICLDQRVASRYICALYEIISFLQIKPCIIIVDCETFKYLDVNVF